MEMTLLGLLSTYSIVEKDIPRIIEHIQYGGNDIARIIEHLQYGGNDIARIIEHLQYGGNDIARIIEHIQYGGNDIARIIEHIQYGGNDIARIIVHKDTLTHCTHIYVQVQTWQKCRIILDGSGYLVVVILIEVGVLE